MVQRSRGRSLAAADRGASALEYGAVILVSAVVIGVLAASSVMDTVAGETRAAICRLFGGDCEAAPPSAVPALSECTVHQNLDQSTTGRKIIAIGDQESETTQVDSNADGSMAVTTSRSSGTGIDLEVGFGGRVGGAGWGVSIGGGVLWTGEDQWQVTAQNQRQLDDYRETLQGRLSDMIDDHGGLLEMMDDEDAMADLADLPLQVAGEMELPAMIINADGTSAFVEVDGSVGSEDAGTGLSGSLRHEETRLLGTSEAIDADGTRVHGEYYAATDTDTARIGLEMAPQPVVGAGYDLTWERVGGNVLHVEYDEDGDPMRVTAVNTSEWRVGRGGSLLLGFEGERGSGGGSGGVLVEDGDVTVNTATIEIPPDRRGEVADELRSMLDGTLDERAQGLVTIAELADGPGATLTRQHYQAEGETQRGGAELDVGIEWFDFGTTKSERSMRLDEAHYLDPATGEWQRWYSCERSAGDGESGD